MLEAHTHHPSELSGEDAAAWRAIRLARPEFESPLLSPEFARAVGDVRPDARVTVWRSAGRPLAFLAYHLRPGRLARPIGAPLSDYHALICEEPIDVAAALRAAGLAAFRFTGLLDPLGAFDGFASGGEDGFVIRLSGSAEDYLEQLRRRSAKRFKNYRRLDHKLGREVGALRIAAPDPDRSAFDTLVGWKRAQLARTGAHDFLAQDWTQALMESLFARRDARFGGLMVGLYAGDRLVAAHFGTREGGVFHPWIAASDPELAAWSPGQVFFLRAIAAMPAIGLTTYDIGPGLEHFKAPYALARRTVRHGCAAAAGPAGRRARAAERVWRLLGAEGDSLSGRLRRRLDAIAALELSLGGRARGLAGAIAARATGRGASADAP